MGKRPKGSGRSGSRSCTDGIGAATARKAWMKNVDRTVAARKSEARRFAGAETGRPHEATARRNVGPRQHLFAVVTVGALLPGLGGVRKLAAASCQSGQCVCPAGASEPPSTWSSSAPAATSAGHGHPRPAPDEGEREDDDHVAPVRHRVAHGPRRWVETEGGCPMPRSGAGSEPVAQHDTRIAALSTLSVVALVCCGGQAAVRTTPDGGIGGSSSSGGTYGGDDAPACPGGYDGGPRPAPTAHRAQPGTCPATIVDLFAASGRTREPAPHAPRPRIAFGTAPSRPTRGACAGNAQPTTASPTPTALRARPASAPRSNTATAATITSASPGTAASTRTAAQACTAHRTRVRAASRAASTATSPPTPASRTPTATAPAGSVRRARTRPRRAHGYARRSRARDSPPRGS